MVFTLESISSAKRIRAPRIVLLGTSKIGKTEFASGSDNPIFLPIKGEEGVDDYDVQAFPVIKSYEEAEEALAVLCGEHNFQTVVVDSASTFSTLVDDMAIRKEGVSNKGILGGGWGHQFDTILIYWKKFMDALDYLRNEKNMTVIIIGHVTIRGSRDPETESFDQWAFDVDKKVAEALVRWADCTLFMKKKVFIKKEKGAFGKEEKIAKDVTGDKRYLCTQSSPTYPAGGRGAYGRLPAEIELPRDNAWQEFMKHVSAVIG